MIDVLWIPDIGVLNRTDENILIKYAYLYPNGDIFIYTWSIDIYSCDFDFELFPNDL